jgi:hypothetical protein
VKTWIMLRVESDGAHQAEIFASDETLIDGVPHVVTESTSFAIPPAMVEQLQMAMKSAQPAFTEQLQRAKFLYADNVRLQKKNQSLVRKITG